MTLKEKIDALQSARTIANTQVVLIDTMRELHLLKRVLFSLLASIRQDGAISAQTVFKLQSLASVLPEKEQLEDILEGRDNGD